MWAFSKSTAPLCWSLLLPPYHQTTFSSVLFFGSHCFAARPKAGITHTPRTQHTRRSSTPLLGGACDRVGLNVVCSRFTYHAPTIRKGEQKYFARLIILKNVKREKKDSGSRTRARPLLYPTSQINQKNKAYHFALLALAASSICCAQFWAVVSLATALDGATPSSFCRLPLNATDDAKNKKGAAHCVQSSPSSP